MKKNKELSLRYYSSLKCRIFVMGAASEGESILFEVYDGDYLIYSCITDSFLLGDTNIPIAIADENSINRIKDIFWTHPHDDHSMGLWDLIEKYRPENVYVPPGLISPPKSISPNSMNVLQKINSIRGYDHRKKYNCNVTEVDANKIILQETLHVNGKIVPFYIYAIAPVSGKIRKKVLMNQYNNLNDYSIAILVVIGDFSIILTGDLQNEMIQYMTDEVQLNIDTPNIVKIPHHGSKGSLDLFSLFEDDYDIDVSICTAKKTDSLPTKESIDQYSQSSRRLYVINDEYANAAVCGMEIDIINATMKEIDLKGYNCYA